MTKSAAPFRSKPTARRALPLGIACLLALFAGTIFSLALAPYGLFPIAIISPMVLYALLINAKNSRQAFWLGECYGFGVWAVGAFWLYHSIHHYGGVPVWAAVVLIGMMALIMGLFHAVMAWIFVRWTARQPLSFAGLWVIQEWLKTWLLTGFPWLFVGYAFTDVGWLNGIAPVTGVFGLSFLAIFLAAALVELLRRKVGYFIIATSLWLITVAVSLLDIDWTHPTGESTSVSLIQGNIPQDLKWQEGAGIQTLGIYAGLSQLEWGRDIVIWPEAAVPMFQDEAQAQIDAIAKQAGDAGSIWMTGILYRDSQDGASRMYNSVLLTDQEKRAIYHKQQLVPFGEYIPMGGLLNVLPGLEGMRGLASLSRGDDNQMPLLAKDQHIGMAICYEVAYPETTRHNAQGSDFLLTVSNDAWFGTTAGPIQHLQMVQMRSLETGRYFVRATNNGVTAIINDQGRIISSLPQFERGILRAEVPSFEGRTPYMLWGSYPILALATILILLSILANQLKNRSARREKFYTAEGVVDR